MSRKLAGMVAFLLALPNVSATAQGPFSQPAATVSVPGVKTTFVKIANGAPGLLYEPVAAGPKAAIALFVMHASGDYLTFSACGELAKRGYRVLCANNSTSKSGAFDDGVVDRVLLEVKSGIVYLKSLPGVRHTLVFGHSGGATLMTAYQLIAEGGVKTCQGPEKIHRCPDTLAGMPPTDGVIVADSNWGQAEMTLLSVDPSVIDESDPVHRDPALDMFNPANGFKPTGSTYSQTFITHFQRAEAERYRTIVKRAEGRLAAIEAGHGAFADDEPFFVAGATFLGNNNKLFSQDVTLLSHTSRPWPLIHKDGTVTTQIVRTMRVPENVENFAPSMARGGLKTTVRNFLGAYAIRTTPAFGYDATGVRGVDWTSTYSSTPGNVAGIHVPLLAMGMTAHWEFLAAEQIYDLSASRDRTLAFVEGAGHTYETCTRCERTPGEFGDTIKTTYDYIDQWLSKPGRFLRD